MFAFSSEQQNNHSNFWESPSCPSLFFHFKRISKKKPKNRKTEKPKNQATKKRETRYYTDDYSLPGSLNTRHEK